MSAIITFINKGLFTVFVVVEFGFKSCGFQLGRMGYN